MKTIKAIFTQTKQQPPFPKAYSFNTELDVNVGDLLQTADYKGKLLQVVSAENDFYSFFSYKSGELCNELAPGCGQIKTLGADTVIVDEKEIAEVYNGF